MSEANKKVCVVIPIHKENPSSFELISFQQSYKILSSHSIYVIAPKGLNIQNYKLDDNSIKITPSSLLPSPSSIQTYEDHRMAMSFSLLGLRVPGIEIADPGCVSKTFPDFYDVLEALRGITPSPAR